MNPILSMPKLPVFGAANPVDHVINHKLVANEDGVWLWSAIQTNMVVVAALLIVLGLWVGNQIKTGDESEGHDRYITKNPLAHMVEVICEYLMANTIEPLLHGRTRAYAPFLLSIFFFILLNNLLGLVPLLDLNHFLLPGSDPDDRTNVKYGAYSMEQLINAMLRAGAQRGQIEAHLFGGANVVKGLSKIGDSNRVFALDFEDGSLDLLATAPIPLEGVVAMKALAHWLTTGLPLTLAAPVLGVLMNLQPGAFGWLVLSLALGTPALSMIGAFGAALTVGLKRGGLLLSLLVLPLYVPTLIFGAEAVRRGADGMATQAPLLLMAGITLAVWALMPFAAAAALRINLR